MRKVYLSGRGLLSPLGRGMAANAAALRSGRSGVVSVPEWVERGFDVQVAGVAPAPEHPLLDRRALRLCPPAGAASVAAVADALAEAGIELDAARGMEIAVLSGVAGSDYVELDKHLDTYRNRGIRAVSPFVGPRIMTSAAVANLSLIFGFTGESYNISAACAGSAMAIVNAVRLIRSGECDIVVAGGAENLDWIQTLGFSAIRALSRSGNADPAAASRPFDRDRDGFVIASGAGYVVLESEASLARRSGRALAEITGVAANSNATDMVMPHVPGEAAVMRKALANAGLPPEAIAYINTHGTATPVGDAAEIAAIQEVFGTHRVAINSTKSQTGHLIGAAGAAELIFASLMQEEKFLSPSINIRTLDPTFETADIVRETRENVELTHVLSNSFAFGGSNVSIVLSRT